MPNDGQPKESGFMKNDFGSVGRDLARGILEQHRDLNFVDRLFNKDKAPIIKNPDGSYSTHLMAMNADEKGVNYVYPTIVQDKNTGKLKKLADKDAWDYARMTGERIAFPKEQEALADWFSQHYKQGVGIPEE